MNQIFYMKYLFSTNEELNDNDSDCSNETLRKRKMFFQDERDILNTEIFLPVLIKEIYDLKFNFLIVKDLSTLKKFR